MTDPVATTRRGVLVSNDTATVDSEAVLDGLQAVIDPELGLDVISLGLVYEVHLAGETVAVMMTLTTPGCPLHGVIRHDVEQRLGAIPGVGGVDVQLVWDPPWTPDRILPAGRKRLGWSPTRDG